MINEDKLRQIIRKVLTEATDYERGCIRSVTEQLQGAKQQLNNALRKLQFSQDFNTETFKRINEIHNEISELLESEYM